MRCKISSPHIQVTEAQKYHILACHRILLLYFADRIKAVKVRLFPVKGPKGGGDRICRLHAGIDQHSSIDTVGRNTDVYLAITQAFVRMEQALANLLDRAHIPNPKFCHKQGPGATSVVPDGAFSASIQ